jgi:hypothetical protein
MQIQFNFYRPFFSAQRESQIKTEPILTVNAVIIKRNKNRRP